MRVLGLDFETTGLDIAKARIIEIGAIMYRVENCVWDKVASYSTLIYDLGDDRITPETTKITGITQEEIEASGKPLIPSIELLAKMGLEADMIVCHNAQFDGGMLRETVKRHNLDVHIPCINHMLAAPWLCSVMDLKSNRDYKCRTLSHLALDRGIAVDPALLHRAVADVELMGKMLTAAKADPVLMLEYQQSPWIYLQGKIAKPWEDGGKEKDMATKIGYSWEKARGTTEPVFSKTWVKRVKECDLEEEKKLAPFDIRVIPVC